MPAINPPDQVFDWIPGHVNRGRPLPIILIGLHRQGGNGNPKEWFLSLDNKPGQEADCTIWVPKQGLPHRFLKDSDTAWTNGPWTSPDTNNPQILRAMQATAKFGVNANSNLCSLTIEFEGFNIEPLTQSQLNYGVQFCYFWILTYNLPVWHAIVRHSDVGPHKQCPGQSFPMAVLTNKVALMMSNDQSFNPNPYNRTVSEDVLDYAKRQRVVISSNEQNYIPGPAQSGLFPVSFTYTEDARLILAYSFEDPNRARAIIIRK